MVSKLLCTHPRLALKRRKHIMNLETYISLDRKAQALILSNFIVYLFFFGKGGGSQLNQRVPSFALCTLKAPRCILTILNPTF